MGQEKFSRTLKEAFGPYANGAQLVDEKTAAQKVLDTLVCVVVSVAGLTFLLFVLRAVYRLFFSGGE